MKLPIWTWLWEEEEMQGGEREERGGICRGRPLGFGGLRGELVLARLGRGPGADASQPKGLGTGQVRSPSSGALSLQISQGLGRSGAWDLDSCTSGQPPDSSVWAGWEATFGQAGGRRGPRKGRAELLNVEKPWDGPRRASAAPELCSSCYRGRGKGRIAPVCGGAWLGGCRRTLFFPLFKQICCDPSSAPSEHQNDWVRQGERSK